MTNEQVKQSQLTALKAITTVVADTGDCEKVKIYKPRDATTNPSLILQAVQSPSYAPIVADVLKHCESLSGTKENRVHEICDILSVRFGIELLKIVPGRVSTEVDANLSFDVDKTLMKARKLMGIYEAHGISRDRVLIKLAATWEGVQACRILESEGIHCNMTLIFNYEQAVACAQAHATLISPFVGRILDWFNAKNPPSEPYTMLTDPGVISVTKIYNYFKQHGHSTTVMGASFRSKDEILGLAGIDALTISPKLLEELESCTEPLSRILDPTKISEIYVALEVTESVFRWGLNEDPMATEKLAEGIRNFNNDLKKLHEVVRARI